MKTKQLFSSERSFWPILLATICLVFTDVRAAKTTISVVAAEPMPNYALTADERDLQQLTDGKILSYKAWTSKESIGWVSRTPVILNAIISGAHPEGLRLLLRMRTAKSISSGVFPPRRVDVYCKVAGGSAWQPGGAYKQGTNQHPDSQNLWLEIALDSRCREELRLVIHADGRFLMLDELELRSTGIAAPSAPVHGDLEVTAATYAETELLGTSLAAMRSDFKTQHHDRINQLLESLPPGAINAWLLPAFDTVEIAALQNSGSPETLAAQIVPRGGDAAAVLAIANAANEPRQYELSLDSDGVGGQDTIFEIAPILAADGNTVYDPLIPVTDRSKLTVSPRSVELFYLHFNVVFQDGTVAISIGDVEGRDKRLEVPIQTLSNVSDNNSSEPRFFMWSYSSDRPIWSSLGETATVDYLANAGVNVFIVHPKYLPLPSKNEKWPDLEADFMNEVSLYKHRGIVLFFLAWDVKLANWDATEDKKREAIREWVAELVSQMERLGFTYDDWALYPVDEPHDKKLKQLAEFAKHIKSVDNRVQLYANPIWSQRDLLLPARINQILPYVDIWQPRAGRMADLISDLLSENSKASFWIYDNPKEPAKSAPPTCYRYLAWQAIDVGATGFGFWSFSDTAGSSAWDDFDGRRPDWAVVYEGEEGLVSSRRWEAAKAGAREFKAARDCVAESARSWRGQASSICRAYIDEVRRSADMAGCLK